MVYRNAVAAIIGYSITDRVSFKQVDLWLRSLEENLPSGVLLSLVGNKADLENRREVTIDEGQEKAAEIHALFSEASAQTCESIDELLVMVASKCFEHLQVKTKEEPANQVEAIDVGQTSKPKDEKRMLLREPWVKDR
jgi:GTPase SAR1 family protein